MIRNPYELPVPADGPSALCVARRRLEPILAEHMEGFSEALTGRIAKDQVKRTRAHTLLRIGMAAANQACEVARQHVSQSNPLAMNAAAFDAALGASTLVANITSFITQMIHMSLDVYPRLLAPNFVSIQPFTQPSGYVFWFSRLAKDNGSGGTGSGRNLSILSTFDKNYGQRTAEGQQVKSVGISMSKELVEVGYYALMHQFSHELDVALRTQYGLDIMALGDLATADELAWEVDRSVIDALVTFALTNPAGTKFFDETKAGTYSSLTPSEQQAYDQTFIRKTLTEVEIEMTTSIYVRPNWYLCGADVAKLLARTPNAYAEDNQNKNFDQSLFKGSVIQTGRMKTGETVWLDPQLDPKMMVCGYTDNMDPFYAGYVFCPFGTASVLTAAFQDPDVLLTKKSRALAFAQKGLKNRQYRVIKLSQTGS